MLGKGVTDLLTHRPTNSCGGANDGRTPILGCTQELWRKDALLHICSHVCGREKEGKGRKSRIERKGRIGGDINYGRCIIVLGET